MPNLASLYLIIDFHWSYNCRNREVDTKEQKGWLNGDQKYINFASTPSVYYILYVQSFFTLFYF